jgi:hypothetical protein
MEQLVEKKKKHINTFQFKNQTLQKYHHKRKTHMHTIMIWNGKQTTLDIKLNTPTIYVFIDLHLVPLNM